MKQILNRIADIFRKGDMILLSLCIAASVYGIVMVSSAVAYNGSRRFVIIQTAALAAGIVIYLALTAFDIDILAGQRTMLFIFNIVIILMLRIWGVEGDTGNRSWLHFSFLPFNIQPAEVCKITYIIILAKTMSVHQNHISSIRCVAPITFHMLALVGLYIVISGDAGVALIFVFIFLVMAYVAGVSLWWFLGAFGAVAVASPYVWTKFIKQYQKNRILALFDPSIDPTGQNILWQTNQNLKALRNGGITGMGLGKGTLTKVGQLSAQHTDSIFCSIGEQLGMIGCIGVILIILLIVIRIIYVGMKSPDTMNRLICMGIASMLLFQTLINIGVCIGLVPVIGLALPFFSYGGSSMITTFVAMGVVSGIKMRPARDTSAHYIRPN